MSITIIDDKTGNAYEVVSYDVAQYGTTILSGDNSEAVGVTRQRWKRR